MTNRKNGLLLLCGLITSFMFMQNFAGEGKQQVEVLSKDEIWNTSGMTLFLKITEQKTPNECHDDIIKFIRTIHGKLSNEIISSNNDTLLMLAVCTYNSAWIKFLLNENPDLELKNKGGWTAEELAESQLSKKQLIITPGNPLTQDQARQNLEQIIQHFANHKFEQAIAILQRKAGAPKKLVDILSAPVPPQFISDPNSNIGTNVDPKIMALHSQILEATVKKMPGLSVYDALKAGVEEVFGATPNTNAESKKAEENVSSSAAAAPAGTKKGKKPRIRTYTEPKPRPLTPAQIKEREKEKARLARREQRERDAQAAAQAVPASQEQELAEAERAREEKAASERRIQEQVAAAAAAQSAHDASSHTEPQTKTAKTNAKVHTQRKSAQQAARAQHHQKRAQRLAAAADFEALKQPVAPEVEKDKKPAAKSQSQLEKEEEKKALEEVMRGMITKSTEIDKKRELNDRADEFYKNKQRQNAVKSLRAFAQAHHKRDVQTARNFHNERLKLNSLIALTVKTRMNQHDAKTASEFRNRTLKKRCLRALNQLATEKCDQNVVRNQKAMEKFLAKLIRDWDKHQEFMLHPDTDRVIDSHFGPMLWNPSLSQPNMLRK